MGNEVEKSRKERLRACERALADHMEEFVKVGLALKEIRDDRLYDVEGFKNFEDYCKARWEFTSRYANYQIEAADLRLKLPDAPRTIVPGDGDDAGGWKESHVRELGRLKSPAKAKAVAERVVKEVKDRKAKGEKVKLGSVVRKHVDAALDTNRKPKKPEKPMLGEVVYKWTGEIKGITALIEEVPEDALQLLGRNDPRLVRDFAAAVARLQKVWEVTGPAPTPEPKVVEV